MGFNRHVPNIGVSIFVSITLEQIMDFRRPRRFRQPSPRAAQSLKDKNVTTYAITYTIAYSKET